MNKIKVYIYPLFSEYNNINHRIIFDFNSFDNTTSPILLDETVYDFVKRRMSWELVIKNIFWVLKR